jgi:hypothetical protein
MPLHEPVRVYTATNNAEAHVLCGILNDAGIEAHVIDDLTQAYPVFDKSQVWVDRSNTDQAKSIVEDYERRLFERQEAEGRKIAAGEATVEADCEECGRCSTFPAAQSGTVQECPHCGAYVDVGDLPDSEEWWNVQDSSRGGDGEA